MVSESQSPVPYHLATPHRGHYRSTAFPGCTLIRGMVSFAQRVNEGTCSARLQLAFTPGRVNPPVRSDFLSARSSPLRKHPFRDIPLYEEWYPFLKG